MIEQIRIRNFKSIRDVTVDLSPVTVFIGRSGVGKSNFLRAIRFLRNYLLHSDSAVQTEGSWRHIFPFGSPVGPSFLLRFTIPGYDRKFEYELAWSSSPGNPTPVLETECLRLGGNDIFGYAKKAWTIWPDASPAPRLEPRPYLGSFPTITEAVLAFTFLTKGIGWHDFPADVFRAARPQNNSRDKGLDDSATNYLDVLRDLTQNLQNQYARRQILSRVQQINSSVTALELDSILQPTKVVVSHNVADTIMPLELSQESDGFRRYYAHLLSLYQTPPKQVLMFEEPENGIFPGALRNLSEEFQNAPDNERGQILMTTQSPDLLDGFDPESIRVVEVDDSQSTRIGPLDPDQLQAVKDRLMEPGELMTVDRARAAVAAT